MTNSINFGNCEEWVAVSKTAAESRMRSDRYTLTERTWWAALWRTNQYGHAQFAPNALAEILGRHDQTEFRWKSAHRSSVSKTIATLTERGDLSPGSKARCLVIPNHVVQFKNRAKGPECVIHSQHPLDLAA